MGQRMLSIVIGTYNRLALLRECIGALAGCVHIDHDIIVIDAGSEDGTLEYLKGLSNITMVSDGELMGQARSLNRVFNRLESKYVCWISDDNVVQDGVLDLAVSILEQNPAIGLVSLKVKDVTGPWVNLPYMGGIWSSGILNCNQGVLSVRLLKSLGGFDERFRDYGIDADLTTRVLLAGYQVVFTKRVAIHHYRGDAGHSWMDAEGRQRRLQTARELYDLKFKELNRLAFKNGYIGVDHLNSFLLFWIDKLYRFAGKYKIPLDKWTGLNERDWRNLVLGRFVSSFDFIRNIRKPYYLVQQMPGKIRLQLQTEPMAGLE